MSLLVKPLTGLLGLVLLVVGVLGFFMAPDGLLLGTFQVNTIHNVVHIVSGLVGLLAFNSSQSHSRSFLIIFGLIYGVVTILGFTMAGGDILGLFTVNAADNYLHLAIAVVALVVGFGGK